MFFANCKKTNELNVSFSFSFFFLLCLLVNNRQFNKLDFFEAACPNLAVRYRDIHRPGRIVPPAIGGDWRWLNVYKILLTLNL